MGKSGDYGGISPKSECGELGPGDIGVSSIGTVAAANVVPGNRPPDESFIVVSLYARWMMPHPIAGSPWSVGASDVSAHRIISNLSAFIGHVDPSKHRILAAGDLNTIYGANAGSLSLVDRERTVWARMGNRGGAEDGGGAQPPATPDQGANANQSAIAKRP